MSTEDLKAKAAAVIASVEDASVKEYLLLKSKSYSLNVVLVAAAVGVVIGLVL